MVKPSPPAIVNLFVAYCLLKRFLWFIYLFVLLMFQQFYSHGSDLINLWSLQHKIDWMSLLVLVILPTIFVFLILDRLGKRKELPDEERK